MTSKEIMELDIKQFRESMHHCEECWNRFHHGLRDKDYLNLEEFLKR